MAHFRYCHHLQTVEMIVEQRRKLFEERLQENITGDAVGWTGLSNAVMETVREVCGESKGQTLGKENVVMV